LFSSDTLYVRDSVGTVNTLVRGDTYVFNCVATFATNGTALNLTNGLLTMTARFAETDATSVFTLTSNGAGIVINNALLGDFTVTIPKTATIPCPKTRTILSYDIQFNLGAVRYTVNRGQLVVLSNITAAA